MGLKSFLIQQGFIADNDNSAAKTSEVKTAPTKDSESLAPTFFPVQPMDTGQKSSGNDSSADPSFVTPLQQDKADKDQPDPSFVKFFENEMLKANLPGQDYFEFRQLLIKTQQKMAAKGGNAPEVVLQAVLMSFEAQDITPVKLVEAARHYKDVLKQKNDDFVKGAETEKSNQLQKRQEVLRDHDDAIHKIQLELQQLDIKKQELNESLNKERTQMDVDKTLGQEGIKKIEKAERLIALAHDYIQASIDADIKRLQNV